MSYIFPGREEQVLLGTMSHSAREAGLQGDRSQVPALLEACQGPLADYFWREGLQALARLGALEALPLLESCIEGSNQYRSNFAFAARARLVAEVGVRNTSVVEDSAKVKVRELFRELNRTHATLNADLYTIRHPATTLNDQGWQFFTASSVPPPQPVAVHALRQLADMVYHGEYAHYSALPDIVLTHFREDYGSALKMRLAPLSRPERLQTLIEELAHKQVLRGETYHDIQLAVNEGEAAGLLTAAKLEEMEANLDEYSHIGFTALFMVLRGLGDPQYEPFLGRFFQAAGKTNCNNLIYYDVQAGRRVTLVSAY